MDIMQTKDKPLLKGAFPPLLLLFCLSFASLYDFHVGVRLFDLLSLVLLGIGFFMVLLSFRRRPESSDLLPRTQRVKLFKRPIGLCIPLRFWIPAFAGMTKIFNWNNSKTNIKETLYNILPFLLFVLYALWGWINLHHSSSLIMIVLAGIGLLITRLPQSTAQKVIDFVPWLILFHMLLFVFQVIAFYGFADKLDYLTLASKSLINSPLSDLVPTSWLQFPESRMGQLGPYAPVILRPTGIFQEPNNYCETMVLLLIMIIDKKKRAWLRYITYGSMLLSQSMYGSGAALILFFFDTMINKRYKFFLGLCLLGLIGLNILLFLGYGFNISSVSRIPNLISDTSFLERYVGLQMAHDLGLTNTTVIQDHCPTDALPFKLLGHGLSSAYFGFCVAKNGMAQFIYATGILAPIILFLLWRNLRQNVSLQKALTLSLGLLLMLLSYPFYTYLFFWLWLGILLSAFKRKIIV
ncbi:MAG TPA: hypothetical protein DD400_02830 [Rhodospirillaceae bacterium]|nr:hypothetical protein [Rhodospirillaceae bacterium]